MAGAQTGDELRLAAALLVNAALLWSCWRVARGFSPGDVVVSLFDALLLWLAAQYVGVAVPGLLGVLNGVTVLTAGVMLAAAGWVGMNLILRGAADPGHRGAVRPDHGEGAGHRWVGMSSTLPLVAMGLFVLGWMVGMIWLERHRPIMVDDALTYHFPAAVQWLQDGRISLFQTWFHNPANTYSPLGGSMLIAWWIGPAGHDVLARFVQAPALLLVMLGLVQLGRRLRDDLVAGGTRPVRMAAGHVAGDLAGAPGAMWQIALLAAAAVMSKPLIRQVTLGKDDLLLCAFFLAAVVALIPRAASASPAGAASDRLGPWRLGIALGLLLATKFTALLVLPLVLLLLDRSLLRRWGAGQWLMVAGLTLLLAGPWYLRGLWLHGNPLFPLEIGIGGFTLFQGLFQAVRHEALGSIAGILHTFTGPESYQTLPAVVWLLLGVGWVGAAIAAGRVVLRRPLPRLCLLGPPLGLGLFLALSPVPELRFVFPAILLLFTCLVAAAQRLPAWAGVGGAAAVLVIAVATSRAWVVTAATLPIALVIAATGTGLWLLHRRIVPLDGKPAGYAIGAAALAMGLATYAGWPAYMEDYQEISLAFWEEQHGSAGQLWSFVREETPAGSVVAYTNSHFVYPLQGLRHERRVVYVPTHPSIERMSDLPRISDPMSMERIIETWNRTLLDSPDAELWLVRLREQGATHLLVMYGGTDIGIPPEAGIASVRPENFHERFANEAGVIYELTLPR